MNEDRQLVRRARVIGLKASSVAAVESFGATSATAAAAAAAGLSEAQITGRARHQGSPCGQIISAWGSARLCVCARAPAYTSASLAPPPLAVILDSWLAG